MSEEKIILTADDGLGNCTKFEVTQTDIDEAMNEGRWTDGFLPSHTNIMTLIIEKYRHKKFYAEVSRFAYRKMKLLDDPEYETYMRLDKKFRLDVAK